jgi:hypothetical protein
MRSLVLAVLLSQFSAPSLYRVTEKNCLTYEVTSYESDGVCYVFHRPNGETSRWLKSRIKSIERIEAPKVAPAPPVPPSPAKKAEIKNAEVKKVLVPEDDVKIEVGKSYMLYAAGDTERNRIDATFTAGQCCAVSTVDRFMNEEQFLRKRAQIPHFELRSGTPVRLLRIGALESGDYHILDYAIVRIESGPCRGMTLFVREDSVKKCHWETVRAD